MSLRELLSRMPFNWQSMTVSLAVSVEQYLLLPINHLASFLEKIPVQECKTKLLDACIMAYSYSSWWLSACRCSGWSASDFTQSKGQLADQKLDAVIARAEAVANSAFLKRTQGLKQALPDFQ